MTGWTGEIAYLLSLPLTIFLIRRWDLGSQKIETRGKKIWFGILMVLALIVELTLTYSVVALTLMNKQINIKDCVDAFLEIMVILVAALSLFGSLFENVMGRHVRAISNAIRVGLSVVLPIMWVANVVLGFVPIDRTVNMVGILLIWCLVMNSKVWKSK